MVTNWDLAGYTEEATGRLGKPIPPAHVVIPGRIWLENGAVCWHYQPTAEERSRDTAPRKHLLNDFVRLWRAPDLRILAFAKSNGVLASHTSPDGWQREPVQEWRTRSREVCALLNIAAALASPNKTAYDPREWVYVPGNRMSDLFNLQNRSEAVERLEMEIIRWIDDVGFSFGRNKKSGRFELKISYRARMLNAIGLQLALVVGNSEYLYMCSGCGYPYSRDRDLRKPKPHQANFCLECGPRRALQQADARRRAKMADARRLSSEGRSISEIAKQLETTPASVKRWLKKGKKA